MELCNGRPLDVAGRLEKEIRVYDLLDKLGITYERIDHEEANTMEACEEIDKVLAPAVICKNLFLINSAGTEYFLIMLRGDKKFRTADVSKKIGSSRLSFASAEEMEEYLDIKPGSVSVMGLMNDKNNVIKVVVDKDVLTQEYFGCHPCVNTSSLRLKTTDVFDTFMKAVNHDFMAIEI